MTNILLTGIGGQGTVLAARLIGEAAIRKGYAVRGSETIGMAQRGGSVTSHIRIAPSTESIYSPLIPEGQADLLLGFDIAEAVRVCSFVKKDGTLIVVQKKDDAQSAELLAFLKENFEKIIVLDPESLQNKRSTNVALLGLAIKNGALPFSTEEIREVIKIKLPPKHWDANFAALEI
ncbi:MAG: 2-oxoacid:acceptor oxidoreductase family protein [Spirochaetaceae bacterium]|jgi:indolepyruvate ferredoxin oxidoreductase beta subunit|nr:2-oxoacid:acceptor oxidoreductase family protein [Spirochaetaceae bacterium]